MNKALYAAITVAIIAAVTLLLRSFAFIAFPAGKPIPKAVRRLGSSLPYGIMGLLVVYCLKDTKITEAPFGLPELISVALTAALQAWRRNSLLSVIVGTICYMVLIRVF